MKNTDRAREQIQIIIQAKSDISHELIKLADKATPEKAYDAFVTNIEASEKFREAIANLQDILDEIDNENERW